MSTASTMFDLSCRRCGKWTSFSHDDLRAHGDLCAPCRRIYRRTEPETSRRNFEPTPATTYVQRPRGTQ